MGSHDRMRRALSRRVELPAVGLLGTALLAGFLMGGRSPNWVGYGNPDGRLVHTLLGEVPLLLASPHRETVGSVSSAFPRLQSTFPEVVEAVRQAWSRQDAGAIVAGARQLLLQLPGSGPRGSVSREQAIRLVDGVLDRSEEVAVRVQAAREVGPGQAYAELLRQYRVAGTEESRTQRILLAYRRDPQRGSWELVELRVLQGSQ